jgi:hypothetical protein
LVLLVFGVFFNTSSFAPPPKEAKAAVVSSDSDLANWRYDPYALVGNNSTFGNVVYDPNNHIYRLFYHDQVANTIRQKTSTNPRVFSGDSLALGHGVAGSPDESQTGVPYAWYEAGQTRPWRMIYRGVRVSDSLASIMLATSVDGVTWERKDTSGNVLLVALTITNAVNNGSGLIRVTCASHPWSTGDQIMIGGVVGTTEANSSSAVNRRYWTITKIDGNTFDLQSSTFTNAYVSGGVAGQSVIQPSNTGLWDSTSIDFGSVIKVGSTYYTYYDVIDISGRAIGLATSTDLVNWTKDTGNPFYTGVTDYDDKNHNGTADATAGFFCGDIVYWPRADGSDRYVMIIPHYTTGSTTPSLDVYTSDTPIFTKANRTYIGKAFETASGTKYLQGYQITDSGTDTPRIITDDITRNVATSQNTGNDVLMVTAVYTGSAQGWNQVMLVHHKTLNGAILSNVSEDLPVTQPTFQLAPTGVDATTKGLWLPGLTGTLRDLTGGNYHLRQATSITGIDSNGVRLTAANSERLRWGSTSGTISPLNAITGDFTVEARVSFASNFTSLYRGIFSDGDTGAYHFYMYVGGAAGPTYTLSFAVSNGGSTKTVSQALGAITLDQMYRIAVCRTGGRIYFFKDGVLLNAGGTAYAWTIDNTPNAQVGVGAGSGGSTYYWDGYIDEIRISDTARWTANYTPAALTYGHQTSGSIFSKTYDFGVNNYQPATISPTVTTPASTAIAQKVRAATSGTDQSSTIGDFSTLPQPSIISQYQQFALNLTTSDVTATPAVSDVGVASVVIAPTATTQAASAITATGATPNGTITTTGGGNSTARGFKYYQSSDCTGAESDKSENGSYSTGDYSLSLTGLTSGTTYSYKAYATSSAGTGTSSVCQSFATLAEAVTASPATSASATATAKRKSYYSYLSGIGGPSNEANAAAFTTTGIVGSSVTFDASSLFAGQNITRYVWDFGDGTTSEGKIVDHTYTVPGRYTVTVTGYDKYGNKSIITNTVDIVPPSPSIDNITSDGMDLIFEGTAYANDTIYLTIHSDPYADKTQANKDGKWTYRLATASEAIGEGTHTVSAIDSYKLSDNTELKSQASDDTKFKVSVDDGKLKVEMIKTSHWRTTALIFGSIIIVLVGAVYALRRRGTMAR